MYNVVPLGLTQDFFNSSINFIIDVPLVSFWLTTSSQKIDLDNILQSFNPLHSVRPFSILINQNSKFTFLPSSQIETFLGNTLISQGTTIGMLFNDQFKLYTYFSPVFDIVLSMHHTTITRTPSILIGFFKAVFFLFSAFLVFTFFSSPYIGTYTPDLFLYSVESSYGLTEAEKEIGAPDDLILPLIFIVIASAGWFFLLFPFYNIWFFSVFTDTLIVFFFCCIIVSLPLNLLFECGFFFSTFFRGASNSTSLIMELLYDLIANTTMFARMQVQHVRVLLGLAMYMETSNYIESVSLGNLITNTSEMYSQFAQTPGQLNSSGLYTVVSLISQIATLIAELGHYILFLLQSSASYAALIFWLFSLLYSGFFKDFLEVYFLYKRTI